jgi:hypothetical protein
MRTGCVICSHKKANEINARLINKSQTGESFQTIADHFGLSKTTLLNHYNGNPDKNELSHIAELLSKSPNAIETLRADNTFSEYQKAKTRIEDLQIRTYDLLALAEVAQDHRACVGYIRECRGLESELREQRKLLAELEGKLATQPQITIINNPEWIELRTVIILALDNYPDAKTAVVNAIRSR